MAIHRSLRGLRRSVVACVALVAAGISSVSHAEAQQSGQVTGIVTDATSGQPLSGVQIFLVDTELGALSRTNGRYLILNVPAGTHQVSAQRIGMGLVTQTVTVTAGDPTVLDFQMQTQALGLDEIVVTGAAGAARRREVGNTINTINVEARRDLPTSTSELLTAAAPGIEVVRTDGMVGQGSRISLRGNSSIATKNTPIVYVDGVRMMSDGFPDKRDTGGSSLRSAHVQPSPWDLINPNDIERIEVIKGSAATTLYGTEAAAGVIQIFTKRGTSGDAQWSFEAQGGTSWSRKFAPEPEPYYYMDDFFRNGAMQTYSASVRGGAPSLQYFVSGMFDHTTGIMPLDEQDQYVLRGNFSFSPAEELQLQWNTSYASLALQNTPTGRNSHGLTQNVFRQSGNYFSDGHPEVTAQNLNWDIFQYVDRLTTGGSATYTPFANFTNRLTVGYDYSVQENRDVRPYGFYFASDGIVYDRTYQRRILTLDYTGTYSFDVTGALRSSLSVGGQAIGDDTRWVSGQGEGIPGSGMQATVSSAALVSSAEERWKVWTAGFFVQNVFDLSDKYFLTMGVRVDGNSNFGEDFGLQLYPKLSASWIMSDEGFWPEQFGQFKLRAAYGESGRAPGAFDAVRTWDAQGFQGQSAFTPGNVGAPDLGPEVTKEIEFGFDASWFGERLTTAFTYYRQTTSDAIINVVQVPSIGFGGTQADNVGTFRNSGTELTLGIQAVNTRNWGWDVDLGFTTNHSEAIDLGGVTELQALQGWIIEGQPVPVFRGKIVTNPDEVGADPIVEDGHIFGPQLPTRTASIQTHVRVPGGVILSAIGEYRGGHVRNISNIDIARQAPAAYCNDTYVEIYQRYDETWFPQLKPDITAWEKARCHPSFFDDDFYMYDSDFFRLRSVSAAIPLTWAFPERVNNATLTLSLNNIWLWTKLPWWDPEMLPQGSAFSAGANAGGYGGDQDEKIPAPHTFRAGIRVTF
jgi:TonB-dependent SusC/RagA subfamily outer membrane receptor